MKTALRVALMLAGLALFGWFVHQAGPAAIANSFVRLGAWAPLVLIPYTVVYVLDTLGWRFALNAEAIPSFRQLFVIRWAGESVNNVIPSAYIGGEAVKVHLLHKHGVPAMAAAASVVNSKTIQILTQVTFIALGALCALGTVPVNSPTGNGMLVICAGAAGVIAALFWLQSHGMFSGVLRLMRALRLPLHAIESKAESLRSLDDRIFGFYKNDRRRFALSTLFYSAGWLCDSLEIYLVAKLLGVPLEWSQAIAIEAFIGVAKGLGLFAPAALGVQESGVVFLCGMFNLPPAFAVSYAVIRRGRDVVFALIGGALLFNEEASWRAIRRDMELKT